MIHFTNTKFQFSILKLLLTIKKVQVQTKEVLVPIFYFRAVLYFLMFGFSGEPFLELIPTTTQGKMKLYKDKTGQYRTSYILQVNMKISYKFTLLLQSLNL